MEQFLIKHCAPTLAGLKTASVFNYRFSSEEELVQNLEASNRQLNGKGIYLEVLHRQDDRALIFVYRKRQLKADLQKHGVADLLAVYGYGNQSVAHCVEYLKHRFALGGNFPHELGIFLGYPLGDVKGFIENAGQNCICTGWWKVYGNEGEAMKIFAEFKQCKHLYQKLFSGGKSVMQLTVAA